MTDSELNLAVSELLGLKPSDQWKVLEHSAFGGGTWHSGPDGTYPAGAPAHYATNLDAIDAAVRVWAGDSLTKRHRYYLALCTLVQGESFDVANASAHDRCLALLSASKESP